MDTMSQKELDKMEWPNELTLRFLDLYRLHPCIWDPKNESHKNKSRVIAAWMDIKNNLGVPFSLKELKRKKESLMAAYRGYRIKMKVSEMSGSVYKPSWFAFAHMDAFLRRVYKVNRSFPIKDLTMESAGGTASLRNAAAHWSLAGDKHLLNVLQGLHERIVTKCQAANSSLEEMVTALDTASINLQNVNNRFMALSNSQFVESRVYDDDIDVATEQTPVKESSKPVDSASELDKIKDSLRILESYHERVQILDSDSDSGSDEEDRVVYKPKDLYGDRPLPYIIGSQQWKSKWHAGLVPEDSDTESDTSKAEPPSEVYSDSAPESDAEPARVEHEQRTISTTSSVGSEPTVPPVGKPADIAAELARRLGGNVPHIPEPEPEITPSVPVLAKLYRPQQPTTATLFSDEPPPLDSYQSDGSYETESDEDIFAELRRKSKQTDRHTDELFKNDSDKGFGEDMYSENQPIPIAKPPSPLFETQNSKSFEAPSQPPPILTDRQTGTSVKKPVGGISLFGNKGTESIGAAILKRHQRKSSSDEESENEPKSNNVENKFIDVADNVDSKEKTQKDMINNLFASDTKDKTQKDIINNLFSKPIKKVEEKKIEKDKPVSKKIDLFADDLFDGIDDIFTTIKAPVKKESVKKSLFDDDDDLFTDLEVPDKSKSKSKQDFNDKSLSYDDLFSDTATISNAKVTKTAQNVDSDELFTKNRDSVNASTSDGVYVKNKDSERIGVTSDGLFTKTKDIDVSSKTKEIIKPKPVNANVNKNEPSISNNVTKSGNLVPEETKSQKESSIKNSAAKSLFDSDSDNDIFSDLNTKSNVLDSRKNQNIEKVQKVEDDFENEDSLFLSKNIDSASKNEPLNLVEDHTNDIKINKDIDSFEDDDSLFLQKDKPTTSSEEVILPKSDDFIKNNDKIDETEDNLFIKAEKVEETIENTPECERKSVIYSEDELFPSNINKNISKIEEKSNILDKTSVLKNQFQSPSLFDEDDDIDELFTKNNETVRTKEIDTKSDQNILTQSQGIENESTDKNTDDIFKTNIDTKSDVPIENIDNLPQNIDKNEIVDSNINISKNIDNETKSNAHIIEAKENTPVESVDEFNEFEDPIPTITESKQENKTEFDNKMDILEEPLFPLPKEAVSDEPDIFSDIFSDVPPEFERTKEPKKSKNVNALFDDDSDDEALFFKKNDVMTDEKPSVSFNTQDDRLFQIFHDEPPAIDVDFTQKPNKINTEILESSDFDQEYKINENKVAKTENIDFDINSESKINENKVVSAKSNNKNVTEILGESDVYTGTESKNIADDAKKPVGKLKPMNFNINVNTLLPGASPKKTKSDEQVDGQTISKNDDEDVEPKMLKSVSFDGDPESEVLDNKLSKERAKIQVKRRPSTRRARKEAVRRSGIDFGEDSTDNSSSTDISKKDDVSEDKNDFNTKKDKHKTDTAKSDIDKNVTKDTSKVNVTKEKVIDNVESSTEISKNVEKTEEFTKNTPNFGKTDNLSYNTRSNVKSKVVYILNDEDIFTNTKPNENVSKNSKNVPERTRSIPIKTQDVPEMTKNTPKQTQNVPDEPQNPSKNKILNIIDDDDELFKSGSSKTITTLGNTKDIRKKEIDNFDSDEDIFKASEKVKIDQNQKHQKNEIDKMEAKIDKLFVESQNTKVKNSLFDLSDDENELFGNKSKKTDIFSGISESKVKKVKLPVDVKGSLFGDESDDDLFGVKTTKHKEPARPSKPKEVTSKASEPVFEDPLSMLGQEDDV